VKREITIKLGGVVISNVRRDGAFVDAGYVSLTPLFDEAAWAVVDALALIDALKDYLYVTVGENDE